MWFLCHFLIIINLELFETSITCPIPRSRYLPNTQIVTVSNVQDVYQRLQYTTAQHVTLEVQNDISNFNVAFNSSFSNTTLVSACGSGFTLSARNLSQIPLFIYNAANVSIQSLNFSVAFIYNESLTSTGFFIPVCSDPILNLQHNSFARKRYYFSGRGCGSVVVADSSNIEIVGNSLYGTLQLISVSNTIVDGNFITTMGNGYHGIDATNTFNYNNLTYSPVVIRNNHVNASEGINLSLLGVAGAMGITVVHNNVSNYGWAGLVSSDGSLMNFFAYNMLSSSPTYPKPQDSTAAYISSWRFGVNNSFEYNYLNLSGSHCFYNDYWSGGTNINCNICANGAFTYKLNMGWKVTIKNLLAYKLGATFAGWCETIQASVCTYHLPPPPTPQWIDMASWIFPMCKNSSYNGIPCSINATYAAISGNCSGLSLLNSVDIANVATRSVDSTTKLPISYSVNATASHVCGNYPIADVLNHYNSSVYPESNVFLDEHGLVHVVSGSQLALDMPCIANFPYSDLGIQDIVWTDVKGILPPITIMNTNSTSNPNTNAMGSNNSGYIISAPIIVVCVGFAIALCIAIHCYVRYEKQKKLKATPQSKMGLEET